MTPAAKISAPPTDTLVPMARATVSPAGPRTEAILASRGITLVSSTPEQRAELLDRTAWTHQFSWKQMEILAGYMSLYQAEPDRVLFHEGDQDAFLAMVVAGALAIRKVDSNRTERVVARLGRGKLVGEMSLIDPAGRSATAVAAEPTALLVLTRRDFVTLGEEHPALALRLTLAIAVTLTHLLRQTTGALVEHLEH